MKRLLFCSAILAAAAAARFGEVGSLPRPPADAPYRNAALPIAARVSDLLSRM